MDFFDKSTPFYKCNFHMHTTKSDGVLTPAEALALYRNAGYDIVSITDHRMVTHVPEDEIPDGLTVYSGIELDYNTFFPNENVHLLGINVNDEIVEKWSDKSTVQEGIDMLNSLCGMTVLAHPAWSLNLPQTIAGLRGIDAVEVWNSVSSLPCTPPRGDSSSLLDVTAAHYGWTAPFVAQDDSHWYRGEQCAGYTMVQAKSKSPDDVLEAIKSGKSYASQGPAFFRITLENGRISVATSPVCAISFATNQTWAPDRVLTSDKGNLTHGNFTIPKGATFVRVQIMNTEGKYAWSDQILL